MSKFIIDETPNMASFNTENTGNALSDKANESLINKLKEKILMSERKFSEIALDEEDNGVDPTEIKQELLDPISQKVNIKPSTKFDDDIMLDIESNYQLLIFVVLIIVDLYAIIDIYF